MDDVIRQLLSTLRGMWQWRWIGLAVAWTVGVIAAVVIYRMPDQYEASARIFVDTQTVLKPLMQGLAVQPNIDQQVMMLSRTLINRPNVEKLTRMADLDHSATSSQAREQLIDGLMKGLQIKSTGRDNLYTLTYRSSAPEKAQRVVQSLTSMFVESSLGDKRKDADSARQFIEDQIKIYEKRLTEAENRLKEFKLRNLSLDTSDGRDSFSRIGEISRALNQARLELREAENSREALRKQIAQEQPSLAAGTTTRGTPDPAAAAAVPELDGRIEALKRNLDSLLQRFTDQHPDVSGTRRVIRELEEQKRQELAARKAAATGAAPAAVTNSVAPNPVYQQLRVSLAEADANVASLQTRVAEYEARYSRSKASMQMVPQIEAEFAQLNRDYDINKRNYENLVSRRESATMAGQMDANAAMAEFRLIDPPRVLPKPVAPNRLLLVQLALLGALAAGMFSTFVASQIRPSFFDARTLREVTGVPVLGTVSLIVSEPTKRQERRSLVAFIAGIVTLLGSYGAAIFALLLLSARTV